MSLYKLTYQFESSGGNIEYQTTQQVRKEADTSNTEVTLLTTGLSLESEAIEGTAIVEVSDDIVPADIFESAAAVHHVSPADTSETAVTETEPDPADDPLPADDIPRFEGSDKMATVLGDVSETPGRGCLLCSNLTPCRSHERDLWFVSVQTTERDVTTELTKADIIEFYRENLDLLEENSELKIGVFHQTTEPTIHTVGCNDLPVFRRPIRRDPEMIYNRPYQLSVVASLTDPQEARKLAERAGSSGVMNVYRFELSKESLVVGTSTHGPGQVEGVFRNSSDDEVCSRELAYRIWYEGLDVSFHPLGVIVDGDLYRPVPATSNTETTSVGEPLHVATYRGSTGKPWQFGLTRHDDELLMTQARASPEKFDPVLKRFPIETQSIGDEPLVFSHTVSRRVWSEDPLNLQVQSQRSEGLVTQFLYADSDGWHLIQPKALGDPSETTDSSFEQTQLDGVSVRSSLLRAETDGDMKATVEHEYRITADVLDSCKSLYALSYHEANEESIDRLEWEIADATAYEIVCEASPQR